MKLQDIIDEIFEETTNEDLKNWFKQKWVNIGKKDKSGKHHLVEQVVIRKDMRNVYLLLKPNL